MDFQLTNPPVVVNHLILLILIFLVMNLAFNAEPSLQPCPGTLYINQVGHKLRDHTASASRMLGLRSAPPCPAILKILRSIHTLVHICKSTYSKSYTKSLGIFKFSKLTAKYLIGTRRKKKKKKQKHTTEYRKGLTSQVKELSRADEARTMQARKPSNIRF